MRAGYFAEQEELIEDMEKYNEKLKQFYEGLKLRKSDPSKASVLMGDAISYFEKFSEKHGDEEEQEDPLKETRERLSNYFDNHGIDYEFKDLSERSWPSYRNRKSRRKSGKDKNSEGSTITTYSLDPDGGSLDVDDILDLAYATAKGDFSDISFSETANASDQDAFNDFVDNDLDMSKFKDYTE